MSYNQVFRAVEDHFDETLLDELSLTQRTFPARVLPDLHLALAELGDFGFTVHHFFAAQQGHQPVMQVAQLFDPSPPMPLVAGAPQYLDVDVGDDQPVRCLTHGLWPDADILFVLTTNRPEVLEEALAARPGRIDQAIEFPYPDEEGRAMLMRLYAHQVPIPPDVIAQAVARTANVSASFIKELMRRAAQFAFERGSDTIGGPDVEAAIDELLVRGGPLNRKLLGADGTEGTLSSQAL